MNLPEVSDNKGFLSPTALDAIRKQAAILVSSKLLPESVDTPEKALVIMLKGRELGLAPLHALSNIHVIKGKPTMSAELMLAMIRKNCKGAVINLVERNNDRCVIVASRPSESPTRFIFTLEDAQRAEITNNPSWRKYPRAMLHARCVSEMARAMFPDAISGVSYTPEEMGAVVNEEGEVIDLPHEPKKEEPKKEEVKEDRPFPSHPQPPIRAAVQQTSPMLDTLKTAKLPEGGGPTDKQLSRLYAIAKSVNLHNEIDKYTYKKYNCMRGFLNRQQYDETCAYFESFKKPKPQARDEEPPLPDAPPIDIGDIPF